MILEFSLISINVLIIIPTLLLSIVYHVCHIFIKSMHSKYFDRISGLLQSFSLLAVVYLILTFLWIIGEVDHVFVEYCIDIVVRVIQTCCAFVSFFLISFVKPFDLVTSTEHRIPKVRRRPILGMPLWQWEVALYLSTVVGLADSLSYLSSYTLTLPLGKPMRLMFGLAIFCISLFAIAVIVTLFVKRGRRLPIRVWTIVFGMLLWLSVIELIHLCIEVIAVVDSALDDHLEEGKLRDTADTFSAILKEIRISLYMLFSGSIVLVHLGLVVHHTTSSAKYQTIDRKRKYIYRGLFGGSV
ncbi:hypothetical protein J8273_7300 [Carpediemonas membranifera]|uniref:Uncharacterized protein n=1 Tax=Carpediemonas membranifera TaxID=201153 RepID=A0A8J6BV40_9EUKA|nr:hypothetical protein J8273_7300 [Carpediemonas membranifera]|eukprot:KAG9391026.1 hypothetical protein J8273_7300 [Carpediemonas membranifera]